MAVDYAHHMRRLIRGYYAMQATACVVGATHVGLALYMIAHQSPILAGLFGCLAGQTAILFVNAAAGREKCRALLRDIERMRREERQ